MSKPVLSNLDFLGNARILNLPAPQNASEPARLADLNSAVEGTAWKDSARVAVFSNVNLLSPGASLNGIAMAVGDRAVLGGQTNPAENGVYIWNGAAVPMTRAPDSDTAVKLEQAAVSIEEGSSTGTTYRQTAVNFVLGTDPVNWTSFGTSTPPASETTAGVAEIATQAEVDAGTDDARLVTPQKLANWSGRIRKFTQTVGDGSATQFDVSHNFNTRDVTVDVVRTGSPYDTILCDISRPDLNTVRLNFAVAPDAGSLRAIVVG